MDTSINVRISADRRRLQNPYAHVDELAQAQALSKYGNPWVYADAQCDSPQEREKLPESHSLSVIEGAATELQRRLWAHRGELGIPVGATPIDVLETEYAAQILGYDYVSLPSLGWMKQGGGRVAVAGLIDNDGRSIKVSSDIEPAVARFTGAHEIGHAVLHQGLTGLHRDRPLTENMGSRNRIEYEADKFAAFFLMPRKLVAKQFLLRFVKPFRFNEETSFALPSNFQRLSSLRETSRMLAGTTNFNGRNFVSLAVYFRLSIEAVAIRLEELGLVDC